jgi:DNA polymerase-1
MAWQGLPEIEHDEVKIGGDVELFYPSWEHKLALPPHADHQTLKTLMSEHGKKFK